MHNSFTTPLYRPVRNNPAMAGNYMGWSSRSSPSETSISFTLKFKTPIVTGAVHTLSEVFHYLNRQDRQGGRKEESLYFFKIYLGSFNRLTNHFHVSTRDKMIVTSTVRF